MTSYVFLRTLPLLLILPLATAQLAAQPLPHQVTGLAILPDGTARLTLQGSVSGLVKITGTVSNQFMQMFDLYPIEVSSNLRDWTRLTTVLRTNNKPNAALFQDSGAANLDQRFYKTPTNHWLTAFPKPSGPYSVGTLDRVMVDPSRTNFYRYDPATNAFMVTFWYPSAPPPAGSPPVPMWDQRLAADTMLYSSAGMDTNWATLAPRLQGHSTRDTPLVSGANRWPIIIYSHGLGSWRKMGSRRAEELASHGYIFIAIDHIDCRSTEFPDGRFLWGIPGGNVGSRLKDMTFLLDQLAVLDLNDSFFAGRLDLNRIAVLGGSFGGMAAQTCRDDARVKCAALWDATNLPSDSGGLQKPFLIAVGENNLFYAQDLELFNKAATDAVFLQLRGADHMTPSDPGGWMAQSPSGRGPAMAYDACVLWFLNTYLRASTDAFPTNREIYNLKRK